MSAELTAQEVFDRVAERLQDGTGRAQDRLYGACKYLTEDGRKCAVGIFIPDGHDGQKVEGSVGYLLEICPDLRSGPIGQHRQLLARLQNIHDTSDVWRGGDLTQSGKKRLRSAAEYFGLDARAVRS